MAPMKKQFGVRSFFAVVLVVAILVVVAERVSSNRLALTSIEVHPGEAEWLILPANHWASRHREIVRIVPGNQKLLILSKAKDAKIAKDLVNEWVKGIRLERERAVGKDEPLRQSNGAQQ